MTPPPTVAPPARDVLQELRQRMLTAALALVPEIDRLVAEGHSLPVHATALRVIREGGRLR